MPVSGRFVSQSSHGEASGDLPISPIAVTDQGLSKLPPVPTEQYAPQTRILHAICVLILGIFDKKSINRWSWDHKSFFRVSAPGGLTNDLLQDSNP